MNKIDDGGPAFPQPATENGYASDNPYNIAGGGMTLRDYIAIHGRNEDIIIFIGLGDNGTSKARYRYADAMIAERNKNAGN